MFAYAANPYVTRIAALALRNITRFVKIIIISWKNRTC